MKITYRLPQITDVDILLDYINSASKEETYIRKQNIQISREEEEKYLKGLIRNITDKKALMLMAFDGETLVGTSDIKISYGAEKHVVFLELSLKRNIEIKVLAQL